MTYRAMTALSKAAAVVFTVALAACGDSEEPTAQASAPTVSVSDESAGDRVVEVEIADGQVSTDDDRVEVRRGDTVRIVVTSDVDDEVHVHGVEQTATLVAGETAAVEFTVDEAGLFEVETHEGDLLLFQLLVQ
jgi:plastocyanin